VTAPAIALVSVAVGILLPPISRQDSHLGRLLLSMVAIGLASAWYFRPAWKPALRRALVAAGVLAGFNYWQFDRDVFVGPGDVTDVTYYYLNSKYLAELDYDQLYAAMLAADQGRLTGHVRTVRNLTTDTLEPASEARSRGEGMVRARFAPDRWEAFRHDASFFLERLSAETLADNFFVDHGYNPPVTWTVLGAPIARAVPVEHLAWATHVDLLFVAGLFAAVLWAFGRDVALFSWLFFATTFSGRWPILGQALLRFDWSAAMVLSVAAAHRGWHALSGASLAFAAWNRVFPALWFLPWGASVLSSLWRERRLTSAHLRLGGAAAAMSALLLATALVAFGPTTSRQSAENLLLHNESFSSHRVGLAGALVWRGETSKADMRAVGGMAPREREVQAMMPALRVLGLAAIAGVALMVHRLRPSAEDASSWPLLPFFILTTPQINYYNLRLLPVLWHARNLDRGEHVLGLCWLFATEVVAHAAQVAGWERHATTSLVSWMMLGWCAGLVAWFVRGREPR
jgi:hypothetical protein